MSAPVMPHAAADAQRRAGLQRMRLLALSLLVFAAVVYLATVRLDPSGVWGYVNAGAEAAMVGALADWFAVTALFRHPLGIPIPHTALVPRRKAELGRSLEAFVDENFLTEEVARGRIASAQLARRVGEWLDDDAHRARVRSELFRIAGAIVGRLPDDRVREIVTEVLLPRVAREPVSAVAGSLLDGVVRDRAHHGLVDLALAEIHHWLIDNPSTFAAVVGERAPWWSPPWVDDRVIGWTYQQALDWLAAVRSDPTHRSRQALDDLLLRLAHNLQHDEDVMARAEALKERLLTHPQVGETAVALWHSLRQAMVTAMDDGDSELSQRVDQWMKEIGARLTSDEQLRDRFEGYLGDAVGFLVRTYGTGIVQVISHTIDQWDGRDAADRIELHVGRDLQFIRINGTLVGSLAGLGIHAVSTLIG